MRAGVQVCRCADVRTLGAGETCGCESSDKGAGN